MKFSLILIVSLFSLCIHLIDAHFKVKDETELHDKKGLNFEVFLKKNNKDHEDKDVKDHHKDHEDKDVKNHHKDYEDVKDHDKDKHDWHSITPKPVTTTKKPTPPHMVCPIHCKHIYCKKKTVCRYKVISVKLELFDKIIYNIEILDSYKGLYGKTATLEVPKSNRKHKIGLNQVFLFMTSDAIANNNNHLILKQGCYNKLFSLLTIEEIAFFSNRPNDYCKKQHEKCDCKIKKCIEKCSSYCIYCDDEESCEAECKLRCEIISWFYLYKKHHALQPRSESEDKL